MNEAAAPKKQVVYPYIAKQGGNKRVLLWIDGGREKDYFFKLPSGELFISDSIDQIRTDLVLMATLKIEWDDFAEIDLDQFWKKIRGLRTGRASSYETCSTILAGWNFLEDLARTVAAPQGLAIFSNKKVQAAYEKIFGGCNLPAVTPEGHEYQPIWQANEIAVLRPAMKELWQCIISKASRLAT